jgi:toxin CcdB
VAQYDVYPNPSAASRDVVPYIVDIQSRLLSQAATRLTVPLRKASATHATLPRRLVPRVSVLGQAYVVYAHQAAPVESRLLKKAVASVAAQAADFVDAIDAVISGV